MRYGVSTLGVCGVLVLLTAVGCVPPNHLDITPTGGLVSFAMGAQARFSIGSNSQLYAFDVEHCRLSMLSRKGGMNTWVACAADGSEFAYTRCHSQSHFTLHRQNTGSKDNTRLGTSSKAYGGPRYIPGKQPHILAFEGR